MQELIEIKKICNPENCKTLKPTYNMLLQSINKNQHNTNYLLCSLYNSYQTSLYYPQYYQPCVYETNYQSYDGIHNYSY